MKINELPKDIQAIIELLLKEENWRQPSLVLSLLQRMDFDNSTNKTHHKDCIYKGCDTRLPIRWHVSHMIKHLLDDTMISEE